MFFLDAFLKGLKPQYDDDGCDRINYYFTPMLLVIFSLTLSAKQYVGQPIQCWIPAQFTGAWEQYSENYCFVQNTYFVRPDTYIPDSLEEREEKEIGYYQWVPFILGLQAILFYLPAMFWRLFNWQSGVAVKSLVNMARDSSNMSADKRKESVQTVSVHIHEALRVQKKIQEFSSVANIVHKGSYLSGLYLFTKVLYVIQVFAQFVILNSFLSTKYTLWGIGILNDLMRGREWEESGHFPRVTMCDFEVRVLANKHRHTVQCVLMINMFNEKVYLFLWFWLLFVAAYTLGNFFYWIAEMFSEQKKKNFISAYLKVYNLYNADDIADEKTLTRFVRHGLRSDGVFILHLISKNAGDIITTELVADLWKKFLDNEAANPASAPLDDVDGFHEKTPLR